MQGYDFDRFVADRHKPDPIWRFGPVSWIPACAGRLRASSAACSRRRSTTCIHAGVPSRRIQDFLSINDGGVGSYFTQAPHYLRSITWPARITQAAMTRLRVPANFPSIMAVTKPMEIKAMPRLLCPVVFTLCLVASAQADIYSANEALARGEFAVAAREFKALAEAGDAGAQASLGYLYYAGEGVPQDYEQAVFWYGKAAVQGNRDAQYNLAVAYAFGEGVGPDLVEAALWYRRAAQQGHTLAQYSLGLSHASGEGVAQDAAEAARWFRAAAGQGYAPAQRQLAHLHNSGVGVARDYAEAARWYQAAAEQGDASAQYQLGALYEAGNGVGQDAGAAAEWYARAADQGHAAALKALAEPEPAADLQVAAEGGEVAAPATGSTLAATPEPALEPASVGATVAGEGTERAGFLGFFSGLFGAKPAAEAATVIPAPASAARVAEEDGEVAAPATGNTVAAAPESGPETGSADLTVAAEEAQRPGLPGFFSGLFGAKSATEAGAAVSAARIDPEAGEAAGPATGGQVVSVPRTPPMAQKEAPPPSEPGLLMAFLGGMLSGEDSEAGADSEAQPAAQVAAVAPAMSARQAALSSLRARAMRGDRGAQYQLGRLYYAGDQVGQDAARAALWYRRAAKQGEMAAQASLAELYLNGEGVGPDRARAMYWYGLAAEQGDTAAGDRLAALQEAQENRPAPAVAAAPPAPTPAPAQPVQDNAQADYERGLGYALGAGAARDEARAFGYFQEAARAGHAPAMYRLALAYADGEGVGQDAERAAEWQQKAALGGHAIAQRSLALMYLNGAGVRPDRARALAWYEIVAAGGKPLDIYRRDRLRAELSAAERQTASELADQIRRRLGAP